MTEEKKDSIPNRSLLMMEKILNVFSSEVEGYLKDEKASSEELILFIMNTINTSACTFFSSFNHFFPDKKIDLKFIKVKLINTLNEEFDRIIEDKVETMN